MKYSDSRTNDIVAATVMENGQRTGIRKLMLPRIGTNGTVIKVGIIGLIEPDWIETLPINESEFFVYTDYIETADQLISELKEEGADMIIALTHMREVNLGSAFFTPFF